jgi:hypothetical protein
VLRLLRREGEQSNTLAVMIAAGSGRMLTIVGQLPMCSTVARR